MDQKLAIAKELPRLRRFARALVRDPVSADDLVQDCVERALSRIGQLKKRDNPGSWLLSIMHNIFRDDLRRSSRRPVFRSMDDLAEDQLSEPPPQNESLAVKAILDALGSLPAERRAAIALIAVEGCSYREAAAILDIPVGTLMSRLSRGREQLREALDLQQSAGVQLRSVKP